MRGEAVMKEATSIKALISSLCNHYGGVCVLRVCVSKYMVTSGVTVRVSIISEGVKCYM